MIDHIQSVQNVYSHKTRKEIFKEKTDCLIEAGKLYPSLEYISSNVSELDLIAAVHEDRTLEQMRKSADNLDSKLFWKNHERFFIFLNSKQLKSKDSSSNYKEIHKAFLYNNKDYASKFKDITPDQLRDYRVKNWKIHNNLCRKMYTSDAPLDVIIPITKF
jgi:hypothetical protein